MLIFTVALLLLPSFAVAVIVAIPDFNAVTTPSESTVAISGALELQLTSSEAASGQVSAESVMLVSRPISSVKVEPVT